MSNGKPVIAWFEIPARDFDRAVTFYENILTTQLTRETMGEETLAVFPYADGVTSGCVMHAKWNGPSADGSVVYLNAGDSISAVLERVPAAGGRVETNRTELPPGMGCYARIIDSEGNRVGLHAMS